MSLEENKAIIRRGFEALNRQDLGARALTRPNRTVIDNGRLENQQLAQLTTALRQQMLKEHARNSLKIV